jgi:dipeptidase
MRVSPSAGTACTIRVHAAHRWSGMATEQAEYLFFLSCDGKTKKTVWMSKPIESMATLNYKRGEKKRKERENKEREEENCADNQKNALNCGYCCHQHAKVAKMEQEESKTAKKKK